MARRMLEDMTPRARREVHKKAWDEVVDKKLKAAPAKEEMARPAKPRKGPRRGLWFVAFVSVVFLFFAFSIFFAGATINVNPRVEKLSLNQNFSAIKGAAKPALQFDIVSLSGEAVKQIKAGEEKEVSRGAEGTAILYNKFGSAPQRLAIDTRLSGSNGKIYKTKKAVVIPGMSGSTPGSVEVGIYAAEPGPSYNSGPLDFNIVGFQGTPKYSKFYARSKGDLRGGFVGKERELAPEEREKVLQELNESLKTKLFQRAKDQLPKGFVLFRDASAVSITSEEFSSKPDTEMVEVKVKGTLNGALLEEKALTQKIAEKNLPGENADNLYLQNFDNLKFSFNEGNSENLATAESLNFNLAGAAQAVWRVEEEKLMRNVLGQKKKDIPQILTTYPNIISANLTIRPFWNRTLPMDAEDIKINVAYP